MKRAMVWGASGGIGQALVDLLVAKGWTVVAIGHHSDVDHDRSSPNMGFRANVNRIDVDVADPYAVEVAVGKAAQFVESIDLWVYSVGDVVKANISELAPATWHRLINANLNGAFHATHYSFPLFAPNAHLFYIGAITECLHLPGFSAYVAAKSALESFVETLRKEELLRRVTLVRPSAVDTPFWAKIPICRPDNVLTPQLVAEKLLFLHENGERAALDITG